jgi:hypothetical protein
VFGVKYELKNVKTCNWITNHTITEGDSNHPGVAGVIYSNYTRFRSEINSPPAVVSTLAVIVIKM